jgi:NADPH:quinone reductase-like Zn-dependent oxidoreductase
MRTMKAWTKSGDRLQLAEVPIPSPASDEMLVRVDAVSLNRGEVRTAALAAEGAIPGWDVAGTVVTPSADGRGPGVGMRVAALLNAGAWAEFARVPVASSAAIPDEVDSADAATLPIAGLTVVRAFTVAGSLLGKRVLITGASGGVGEIAIQLAAMSSATVTAITTRRERFAAIRELGAASVHSVIEEADGNYDLVLESVGGRSLAAAISLLAREGVVVTIGNSAEEETTFNARTLYGKGAARIYGLLIFEEIASRRVGGRELGYLLELVRRGRLRPAIEVRRRWDELPKVLEQLEKRAFAGKAVLTFA